MPYRFAALRKYFEAYVVTSIAYVLNDSYVTWSVLQSRSGSPQVIYSITLMVIGLASAIFAIGFCQQACEDSTLLIEQVFKISNPTIILRWSLKVFVPIQDYY